MDNRESKAITAATPTLDADPTHGPAVTSDQQYAADQLARLAIERQNSGFVQAVWGGVAQILSSRSMPGTSATAKI